MCLSLGPLSPAHSEMEMFCFFSNLPCEVGGGLSAIEVITDQGRSKAVNGCGAAG